MISSVVHYHSLTLSNITKFGSELPAVFPWGISESFTIFAVLAAELNSSRGSYLVLSLQVLVRYENHPSQKL